MPTNEHSFHLPTTYEVAGRCTLEGRITAAKSKLSERYLCLRLVRCFMVHFMTWPMNLK